MRKSVSIAVLAAFAAGVGDAPAQTVLHQFQGSAYDFLGMAVGDAGDVDGDGRADVIAGALGYGQGPRAVVYSGATGNVLHVFPAGQLGSCAGAGDVDQDGFADLVVGDTSGAAFGPNTGTARVYSGSTGLALHVFAGSAARDWFGASVAGAGDVDGDGFADVIVGAPQSSTTSPGPGYAAVYSGQTGALLHVFTGLTASSLFGASVARAGDVDADGRDDLVVGAWREDVNGQDSGMARVFSGASGALLLQIDGALPDDWLGRSVAGAGDVDRDGRADVFVGSPGDDTAAGYAGAARVHSGLDGSVLHTFFGEAVAQDLGSAVAGAGDVNGDGFPDLLAGAPGGASYARVWSGRDGSVLYTLPGVANAGTAVGGGGDVDGDCLPDVIVGDPVAGAGQPETGLVAVYAGLAPGPGTGFCSGDGTGAPCPCANTGCKGHGCENSFGTGGGLLQATGTASVSGDTVALQAGGLPPTSSVIFLQGSAQAGGGAGLPVGDGLRCVAGAIVRLGVRQASNGFAAFGHLVPGDPTVSAQGGVPPAGGTFHYQAWYRNPAAFCAPETYNWTNGISITWSP